MVEALGIIIDRCPKGIPFKMKAKLLKKIAVTNCFGFAIINNKVKAIAGISVTGPSSRFNLTTIKKAKNTLINISKEISKQLNEINNLHIKE